MRVVAIALAKMRLDRAHRELRPIGGLLGPQAIDHDLGGGELARTEVG
jgi:hypothetical protein